MNQTLSLPEELLLLALRDEAGTIEPGAQYQYAIGGAIVAELLLGGRLQVDDSRRRKLVEVVDSSPFGNELLDESLEKITAAKRRANLQTWVSRFAQSSTLKHRVARGLVDRGVLREEEGKVLFVFTRKLYPENDPGPERSLVESLRTTIFGDAPDVDPRRVVLVSLAHHSGLLRIPFTRKELKPRKARIEELIRGELAGAATKEALEAMQAAIMVATIMPAIMTTTVISS